MGKQMNDRLQWLEEELWEVELPEDEQEFSLDDILGEFSGEAETPAMPTHRTPSRNRASEFDRMAFGDEDFDESTAVLVSRKKEKAPKGEKTAKGTAQKGTKGLIILAIVEVIAIIGVLLRWVLWFL